MTIPAGKILTNLKGEPLKDGEDDVTLGSALANMLLGAQEGGKMKLYSLAQEVYKGKNLEVDAADLALIKGVVEKSGTYSALVSGQILLALEEVSSKKPD